MHFNAGQLATLATFLVSNAHAWNVEIFKTDDCSGNPTVIHGDVAGSVGCIPLTDITVDLKSLWLDYDDEQHHNVILYQDENCKCEITHGFTCPGAMTLGVGKCTKDPFGNPIKSVLIELNGSSGN